MGVLVLALELPAFDRIFAGVREGLRDDGLAVLVGVTGGDSNE